MGGKDRGRGRQAGVCLALLRGNSRPRILRVDGRGAYILRCPRDPHGTSASRSPRFFTETLDYVISVGHLNGGDSRPELGYPGSGPTTIIQDPGTKELTPVALHPGASAEGAREAAGRDLRVADKVTTAATREEAS